MVKKSEPFAAANAEVGSSAGGRFSWSPATANFMKVVPILHELDRRDLPHWLFVHTGQRTTI
jgi:hypothetical protein